MDPLNDARAALLALVAADGGGSGRFRFAPSLAVFAGHFPGRPLVPGVYQLACCQVVAEHRLGHHLVLVATHRIKWQRPVLPGETIEARIALAREGDDWSVRCGVSVDSQPCAGGGLVMRPLN